MRKYGTSYRLNMMRRLLLSLLVLSLTGCIFDLGRCRYEHRSLVLSGTLAGTGQPGGEPPIMAELMLNESRGGPDYQILAINLRAPSVHGITAVEVIEAKDGGATILATFAVGNTTEPGYWHADIGHQAPPPSHSRLKFAAVGRHLRLVARYGNQGTAEGSLRIVSDGGWERPYCS